VQKKIEAKKLNRILDANFNRAKEGLRVCEDVCRFVFSHKIATQKYKNVRHKLTDIIFSLKIADMITSRDSREDVGRFASDVEYNRKSIEDVFYANSQRVKESLRVLEELTKLIDRKIATRLKRLRYALYEIERSTVKKF